MSSLAVEEIISGALQLPDTERAAIAERLIASLDSEPDEDVEEAWQEEIQRRINEVDQGLVECIPWEKARQKLAQNRHA